MAKDMWSGVFEAPERGHCMRCLKGKLLLFLDIDSQSQQDATKVIKKAETQNLSRNELTFGNEQDELVVTKGLKWKAISTFH